MTDRLLASHNLKGPRLRIDTSVPSPSLDVPSHSVPTWQSPASPYTPALTQSEASGRSSISPGTPMLLAPWATSPIKRYSSDFEARGYENLVHSGEPRDSKSWSLKRATSVLKTRRKPNAQEVVDSQLANLTANVIARGLDDWSLVEHICRIAASQDASADCVLKTIIRCLMEMGSSNFQQDLWAVLMKKSNTTVWIRAAQPKFIESLEQIVLSPTIEMVAADRLTAVLATVIDDEQCQDVTNKFHEVWAKIRSHRILDSTPLYPEDDIYQPGSLLHTSRRLACQDTTIADPYLEPTDSSVSASPTGEDKATGPKVKAMEPKIRVAALSGAQNLAFYTAEDPPPYSPYSPSSQPGPSSISYSVVDTYPFAKGYASDVGPDIDVGSVEPNPFAKGAFGDVRCASLRNGTRIAIKCLRFYTSARDTGQHRLEKKSLKEIRVWSLLKHQNVLPLVGLCVINNELGMVSEFMPNGNIQEYIRKNPGVDRYQLAIHICSGLTYLHEHPKRVIHEDLKAVNVVVDANGIPKLTDFGLAQMVRSEDSTERSTSSNIGGTARWMAYEQLCPTAPETTCSKPNSQSDIYSLGMTLYEVFSGKLPFEKLRNDAQVISAVMRGVLPEHLPDCFSTQLWELLNQCWRRNPNERPSARAILGRLQIIAELEQ